MQLNYLYLLAMWNLSPKNLWSSGYLLGFSRKISKTEWLMATYTNFDFWNWFNQYFLYLTLGPLPFSFFVIPVNTETFFKEKIYIFMCMIGSRTWSQDCVYYS